VRDLDSGASRHWKPPLTTYTPPQPRYCEKCGRELDVIDNRIEKFDRFTGEGYKRGMVTLRCPEWEQDPTSVKMEDNGHDNMPWNPDQKPVHATWNGPTMGPHYRNGNLIGDK